MADRAKTDGMKFDGKEWRNWWDRSSEATKSLFDSNFYPQGTMRYYNKLANTPGEFFAQMAKDVEAGDPAAIKLAVHFFSRRLIA